MKKLLVILIAAMTLPVFAQSHHSAFSGILTMMLRAQQANNLKHFNFQGIMLTGSPANFEAKLIKKGFKPAVLEFFASAEIMPHIFTGTYEGRESTVEVLITPNSGLVYGVKVSIMGLKTETQKNDLFNSLKKAIENKHSNPPIYEISPTKHQYKVNYGFIGIVINSEMNSVDVYYLDEANSKILEKEYEE